jgi:tRNA(fMet)-specific endonuclease VapC
MAGKLLADTSVIIDMFAGDEVAQRLMATAEKVRVPSIALGELFYGAQRSGREAELKRVTRSPPPLRCSHVTLRQRDDTVS